MKEFMKNPWLTITIVLAASAALLASAPQHAWAGTPEKKIPITLHADKLDYDRINDVYVAVGHVKIEQEGIRLEADKVVMNNKTGVAEAEGNVYLQDKDNVVHAAKLTTNLRTSEGVIYKGSLYSKKGNIHLKGDVIERKSETVYHVEDGEITTCDNGEWFIKAKELNIDMAGYATGRGVTITVDNVPVLYTPYFLFPVRRQTGFLLPEPGYSRTEGFFVTNTFFWAISDSKDLTLTSDYRDKIGNGTGADYRYNYSRESMGEVQGHYWDIMHTEVPMWDFGWKHKEEFADDLSARVDINQVSDYNFYHDLEHDLALKSRPYLDSNAFYVERWNTASLYLLGQYSTNLTQGNENTVQKLPEVRYTIYEENLAGPVHVNFDGSATNFTREAGQNTRREDFNPELSATFSAGGLSLTPRVGARATFYDRSANSDQPTEREYTYAAVDLDSRISKIYGSDVDAGIGRIRHSIEPSIAYTYIPYVNQQNIPQFDSVDNVVAQNALTYSIINRLTAQYKESKDAQQYSTFDMMVFRLQQSYNLSVASNQTNTTRALSSILGELYIKTPKAFTLTANANYDPYGHMISSRSVGAIYTEKVFTLNLAENYVQNPAAHYIIGGGTLNLGSRWVVNAELWRDIENRRTTEQDYIVNYKSQCWGLKLLFSESPGNTRFTVLFDLKSLGSKGQPN